MNKKVKFLSVAASMALAASLGTPALAASSNVVTATGGTDVYAGVTTNENASRTNLKVTVPTLFSFVVATAAEGSPTEISVEKGTLLLPNVQVDGDGKVSTVGQSQLTFTNYSTMVNGSSKSGVDVSVSGAVSTAGTSSKWNYKATEGEVTKAYDYHLTLGGAPFGTLQADGSYACDTPVTLAAPTVAQDTVLAADNTAPVGSTTAANIGVKVGGQPSGYVADEASAKVGTIVWTITADYT